MKKLNKYLFVLAAAVFTFTACEQDPKREPSPEFPTDVADIYFVSSDERGDEIDPSAGIYTHTVSIARRDSVGELAVALIVTTNSDSIFQVPDSVVFKDGEKEAKFVVDFTGAKDGVTYSLALKVNLALTNPYTVGYSEYLYDVTPIKWENGEKPAILVDGLFSAGFGITGYKWYVEYQRAKLGGGAQKVRLINAYASRATAVDSWGILNGCAYNDPGDYDDTKPYHTLLEINSKGEVSMPRHALGVTWSYGAFEAGTVRDYNPEKYGDVDLGELDKNDVITIPGGSLFLYFPTLGGAYFSSADWVLYLDPQVYYDENSSVKLSDFEDGFNDAGIAWDTVPGGYTRFATTIFTEGGNAWDQVLLNAVDPNAADSTIGDESDFYNLYMLPDLYVQGYGFAFYYDSVKGSIRIPKDPQPTGVTIAGKKLFLVPNAEEESTTEIVQIKGQDVTLFHFNVDLVTEDEITFGSYEEQFFFSVEPILFVLEDFTGSYIASGNPLFQGQPALANQPISILDAGVEGFVYVDGFDLADSLVASLDFTTGVMTIVPQALPDYEEEGQTYKMEFRTFLPSNSVSKTAAMQFSKNDNGVFVITDASPAIGYVIYGENVDDPSDAGYFDGYYYVKMAPATAAAAPVRKISGRHSLQKSLKKVNATVGKQISTEHLSAQGKYDSHRVAKSAILH